MTKPLSKEDILKLAPVKDRRYWIDETIKSIKRSRSFDMAGWCTCIAHHVSKVTKHKLPRMTMGQTEVTMVQMVSQYFELTYHDALALCVPPFAYDESDAIQTLVGLRDTGKVEWPPHRISTVALEDLRMIIRQHFPRSMVEMANYIGH